MQVAPLEEEPEGQQAHRMGLLPENDEIRYWLHYFLLLLFSPR
jgi:hypothetical protein